MLFSERKELSDKYEKWLQEHEGVKDCPFNVISYLDTMGYLKQLKRNEEKIVKYETPISKDDIKRILDAPPLITDVLKEQIKAIEQGLNQYIYEKSVAENKSPTQVCEDIFKEYEGMTCGDFWKKIKGDIYEEN